MRLRTHKFFMTVVYGVVLTVLALIAFSTINAGIDLLMVNDGNIDPKYAAIVGFGILGLVHSIAIHFFTDDDAIAADGGWAELTIPDSATGFIRQAGYRVFSVGPVFAVFAATSIFIWHAIAAVPGESGTVWGDYGSSPSPALIVFLSCWSAVNIGFTFASCAEAFHRDLFALFVTILVAMAFVGLGITVGFLFLPAQSTGSALISVVIAFPVSLFALVGARAWAKVRVARWDAADPRQLQRLQPRWDGIDPSTPGSPYPGGPPFDMLRRGEKLLMHFKSERTPEPQLLIVTNQRVVRASILGSDRTFILDQTEPGQLSGVTSQRVGHDLMTTAHFHDRSDVQVVGGDPAQSRAFAVAVARLARTGKVRR
ncbi:MAG: DUF4229 domain-containing protein [Brevibacterium sp.]|nr:DUF4229 domain-containing protein [Brevibacterium sp.]